jgi:undecaprenyl pyrophosphate phosphatase UppP
MFFDLLKSIILGIVEGITEFLPISSTGHLIIVNQWISFDADFTKLFDIVIQLGAILSVVVFFWNRLWPFGKDKEKNKEIWSIWSKTIVGVLPAIVIGALLANKIEEKFFNPLTVAVMLIAGGAVLIWLESRKTGTVPIFFGQRHDISYSCLYWTFPMSRHDPRHLAFGCHYYRRDASWRVASRCCGILIFPRNTNHGCRFRL